MDDTKMLSRTWQVLERHMRLHIEGTSQPPLDRPIGSVI